MRTILVLAGGYSSDTSVFSTALAVARRLGAHLEFLHVRVDAGVAALNMPHVSFAQGAALHAALGDLDDNAAARSATALHHFEELCEREAIEIAISPCTRTSASVPASWHEERNAGIRAMIHCARHNDLVVVGRPTRSNGLPHDLAERLLAESGRPLLLAPAAVRAQMTGTALVCWKEKADSARALAAALPLLAHSKRVVIASADEGHGSPRNLDHLAQRLEWNGIVADTRWLPADTQPVTQRLESVADEIDADLIVMGGHGHGALREMMFGGCTRHFLDRGDRPVLMMH